MARARRISAALALLALASLLVAATNDPLAGDQWHLEQVGAPAAWSAARGEGVVVAVLDTGVDVTHPDLAGRTVPGIDLVDPGTAPDDPNGHGTLVAGVVAAVADNGRGVAGVAPLARVMPVRVLDEQGRGDSAAVAEGIRWAVDNGAHVVNVSLTEVDAPADPRQLTERTLITGEVEAAMRRAVERGVVVVASAGNDGQDRTPYRADTAAIVVGATQRDDAVWPHSNRDERTLFAPGVDIVSTWLEHGYARADGTSFATPVVAAGAALLRQRGLDAAAVGERLAATAVDVGEGRGRVDLGAALSVPAARRPARQQPASTPPATPSRPASSPQPVAEPVGRSAPATQAPVIEEPAPAETPPPEEALEAEPAQIAVDPVLEEPEPAAAAAPTDIPLAAPPASSLSVSTGGGGRWPIGVAAGLLAADLLACGVLVSRRRPAAPR